MKRVIAVFILFSISLTASADIKTHSHEEELQAINELETQQVRFRPHGKYHMRHQKFNKKVTSKYSDCEHKNIKHAFSNSSRPR
ncbi:MAG: hypothetical protein V7765_17550 [Oleispira sp.]